MSIDELEQQVLGQARSSFEQGHDEEIAALSRMQKRLAAAPLAGLVGLDLPPLPDVSGAFAAVQQSAAFQTAIAAQAPQTSSVAAAAATTSTKVGVIALASQLTPAKIILAAALVGGGAGVSYGVVTPSPDATQQAHHDALERVPSPSSALAGQDPISQDIGARHPPLEDTTEKVSPEVERPAEAKPSVKKSQAESSLASSGSRNSGSTLQPLTAATPPAVSSFNDEFTYLRKAQNALRSGDAQTAWQLMVTLDQERPTGALIPERRMTKVLALCALGRGEQAQTVARTVLNSSSGPMYRSRIEKSCAKAVELPKATGTTASGPSTASFPDRLK